MKKFRRTLGRHRLRRHLAILSLSAAVGLAMLSVPLIPRADANPVVGKAGQLTPAADLQLFASQVETLGAEHYSSSFAGAVLTPAGVTQVYALPAADSTLIGAIDAINPSRYPVEILVAPRSYDQLNALNANLMAANNTIKAHGVTLSQSAPDPATGAITVSVAQPTAADIATLSHDQGVAARIGGAVTAANFTSAVSALLRNELGAGFTVESNYLPTATIPDGKRSAALPAQARHAIPKDPFNDGPPFFGGDSIIATPSQIACTGSFMVTGNRSGHTFLFTAGHCSQNNPDDFDIFPSGTAIGPVSTNYWVPGTTNDFLTIYVPGGGLPYIWGVGNNLHPVKGALLPAVGVLMTFNGAVTGEVPHNTVTAVNATDMNVVDSNSGRTYNIFPVVQAAPPKSTVSCQVGDSGGPAYQRTSSSPVYAIGSIAAFFGGPGITILCSAQQIGYEEQVTNTSLMTTG